MYGRTQNGLAVGKAAGFISGDFRDFYPRKQSDLITCRQLRCASLLGKSTLTFSRQCAHVRCQWRRSMNGTGWQFHAYLLERSPMPSSLLLGPDATTDNAYHYDTSWLFCATLPSVIYYVLTDSTEPKTSLIFPSSTTTAIEPSAEKRNALSHKQYRSRSHFLITALQTTSQTKLQAHAYIHSTTLLVMSDVERGK